MPKFVNANLLNIRHNKITRFSENSVFFFPFARTQHHAQLRNYVPQPSRLFQVYILFKRLNTAKIISLFLTIVNKVRAIILFKMEA